MYVKSACSKAVLNTQHMTGNGMASTLVQNKSLYYS